MPKIADFRKSVHDLCTEDGEILEIMKELGFENITNPAMLNTAGRFMTIPKGAAMKGIDLDKIKTAFVLRGYEVKE